MQTFGNLNIGDRFEFDRVGSTVSGLANGPWVKRSPRKYCHEDDQKKFLKHVSIKVGSIKVAVTKLEPKKVGEYYADYDEDSALYCVFHTDINSGHAYSTHASMQQAEAHAVELNQGN